MKRLSLQWRITLMTAALIGVTCVLINCLIGYSGKRYMDAIGSGISAYSEIESGAPDAFDPQSKQPDDELTIIISGAQAAFGVTNWYITAAVTLAGGDVAVARDVEIGKVPRDDALGGRGLFHLADEGQIIFFERVVKARAVRAAFLAAHRL